MTVKRLYGGSWYANCYLVANMGNDGRMHAVVIDPACPEKMIADAVLELGAVIDAIVLTHGHFVHIYFADKLRDATSAPLYVHKNDAEMLCDGNKNAYSAFFGGTFTVREANGMLEDGDVISIGSSSLKVISTEGHSKGSVCLLGDDFIITGDTLFARGYGRYDLHGGDARALSRSLHLLRQYDPELTIYPGHGESATLGDALDSIYF